MNLHAIVRGAITSVNPDILGMWRESTGYVVGSNYKPAPQYTDHQNIPMQVQALSGRDIKRLNYLGIQGVKRAVYMYGNKQGLVRPNDQGGDLLVFPEVPGGEPKVWLISIVFETWPDWCRVGVTLQTNMTAITTESGFAIITESGVKLSTE